MTKDNSAHSAQCGCSRRFQPSRFLLQEFCLAVFGEIDSGERESQRPGDLSWRPTLHHVVIEDLELPLFELRARLLQGLGDQVLLPGRVPFGA